MALNLEKRMISEAIEAIPDDTVLIFNELRRTNLERDKEGYGSLLDKWSFSEFGNAMAGNVEKPAI